MLKEKKCVPIVSPIFTSDVSKLSMQSFNEINFLSHVAFSRLKVDETIGERKKVV